MIPLPKDFSDILIKYLFKTNNLKWSKMKNILILLTILIFNGCGGSSSDSETNSTDSISNEINNNSFKKEEITSSVIDEFTPPIYTEITMELPPLPTN